MSFLETLPKSKGICIDTRTLKAGEIFITVSGPSFNANNFIQTALDNGAMAVYADNPSPELLKNPKVIKINNGLLFLQEMARAYRHLFKIEVLGLTGSNGKTTTKELLQAVFSTSFKTHSTKGNLNNHIGVPLTLLNMPLDTEFAIIEMGANKPGDIAELYEIATPSCGLITNIGHAHLEGFGGIEGVYSTKTELFEGIGKKDGLIFINEGDSRLRKYHSEIQKAVRYGLKNPDGIYFSELKTEKAGISLKIHHPKSPDGFGIHSALQGAHNAENILSASTVALHFGITEKNIQKGISSYIPSNNRGQITNYKGKKVFLDAYNANPTSMKAGLGSFFDIESGKKMVVLGDMFELGQKEKQLHTDLGDFVNNLQPDITIAIGPLMKGLALKIKSDTYWFPDVISAKDQFEKSLILVESIFIKGSRGMALEKILD